VLMALFMACVVLGDARTWLSYDTLAGLRVYGRAAAALEARPPLDADRGARDGVQLVYWACPLLQIGARQSGMCRGPALIAPAFALYALTRLRASPAAGRRRFDARCHSRPDRREQRAAGPSVIPGPA